MNAIAGPLAQRLLTALFAVAVSLPNGWCCAGESPLSDGRMPATAEKGGCCASHVRESRDGRPDRPHRPVADDCCCSHDAVVPAVERTLPHVNFIGIAAAPEALIAAADFVDAAALLFAAESPPHRILHCVWRC
jgi:hypothetical protein